MRLSEYPRYIAISCHAVLIVSLMIWAGPIVGLVLAIPLIVTLPGLWRSRSYTAGWASMLLLFYIGALVSEGMTMPLRRVLAYPLSFVAMFDFLSLVLFVRLAARERAAALPMPSAQTGSSADAAH